MSKVLHTQLILSRQHLGMALESLLLVRSNLYTKRVMIDGVLLGTVEDNMFVELASGTKLKILEDNPTNPETKTVKVKPVGFVNPDGKTCGICKRQLDDPNDISTLDCGGDCLKCMQQIEEESGHNE